MTTSSWWSRLAFWRRPELRQEPPEALPARPSKGIASASVAPGDQWVQHQARGLTIERIGSIFGQAELGETKAQCQLFADLIEVDAHARSQFETRIDSVAGKTWLMQAGGTAEVDRIAAEKLKEALDLAPNWEETAEHLLWHNAYGFAAVEIEWGRREGWTVPVWFELVEPARFRFVDDNLRLLTSEAPNEGVPLEPGRWIVHRRRGVPTARAGLMRTIAWLSLFKSWALRDWVIFAQRFGVPLILGKYDPTMSPTEKAALRDAVRALGKDGRALLPRLAEIEIKEIEKGGKADDLHNALLQALNREESKLITGATLTMETGTQGGSYAQSIVHQGVRFELTLADNARIGRAIARSLGAAFVHFNGLPAKWPFPVWNVSPEVDPLTRIQIAAIYKTELGGRLSDDQMRRENNFQRPIGDDDALEGPAPAAPAAEEDPEEKAA